MRKSIIFIAGFVCAGFIAANLDVANAAWDRVVYAAKYLIVGAGTTNLGLATLRGHTASQDVLHVRGAASQTGDFIEVSNSAGTKLFSVGSDGAAAGAAFGFDGVTEDVCPTYGPGAIFYNSTSGYMCFCDGSTDDLKMNDNTTACF